MPKFLQGKPTWMTTVFAVIVVLCGLLGADVLSQLVEYHRAEPLGDLSSHADSAPQTSSKRSVFASIFGIAPDPTPTPSPSPSASASPSPGPTTTEELPKTEPSAESHPETAVMVPTYHQEESATVPTENLDENKDLKLQGVMVGDSAGIAVLEYAGDTYTVGKGDKVGNYEVADIKADRVTLDNHGQLSQVRIDVPKDAQSASAAPPTKAVGAYPPVLPPPNDVPLPPQPVTLPEVSAPKVSPSEHEAVYSITEADFQGEAQPVSESSELTREELDEFTRKGSALMSDIRGKEVVNGRGVQVEFRNPDNALAKLGMRDGDVILRINSRSVVGIEDVYNSVLVMRDAPQIDIEIQRNGQPMSLFHRFPER